MQLVGLSASPAGRLFSSMIDHESKLIFGGNGWAVFTCWFVPSGLAVEESRSAPRGKRLTVGGVLLLARR